MYITFIYILSTIKISAGAFGFRRLQSFVAWALLENTALADVSDTWLEMTACARPGATNCSKWPLEPALEPQNARKALLALGPKLQNA